jgi:hypothetical protein
MMGQLAMRKILPFLSALVMAGFAAHASADTCGTIVGVDDATPDNISVNTTWGGGANPSPICLQSVIFIKGGATLTILPGTIVRGQPRSGPTGGVAGSPGALVITRTGKLISDGTANNPIIFTTAAVDNDGDGRADDLDANGRLDRWPGFIPGGGCPGACTPAVAGTFLDANPKTAPIPPLDSAGNANVTEWGGVMILGKAPTNLANTYGTPFGHGTGFVEGLAEPGFDTSDATCGGLEPHDSSGIIRYTSVQHGGDEIGASNEINGFTLCAVGDNTIFEYNEVYANFDDAFEFFGGTLNVNHLVSEYNGDDNYDVDWGYTGGMQFLFAIKPFFKTDSNANFGQAGGDGLVEADGTDYEQEPGQRLLQRQRPHRLLVGRVLGRSARPGSGVDEQGAVADVGSVHRELHRHRWPDRCGREPESAGVRGTRDQGRAVSPRLRGSGAEQLVREPGDGALPRRRYHRGSGAGRLRHDFDGHQRPDPIRVVVVR